LSNITRLTHLLPGLYVHILSPGHYQLFTSISGGSFTFAMLYGLVLHAYWFTATLYSPVKLHLYYVIFWYKFYTFSTYSLTIL